MKKNYFSLFAAATMMTAVTSCSQEEDFSPVQSGEMTTFKVYLEGAASSRAAGDGMTATKLYFEVYQGTKKVVDNFGEGKTNHYAEPVTLDGGKAEIKLPLLRGEKYDIMFWAQAAEGSIYDPTDLQGIKVNYKNDADENQTLANVEEYDAFFYGQSDFQATANVTEIKLRRPFAQLNIGTTDDDWKTAITMIDDTYKPVTTSEVTVTGLANKFNVLAGEATGSEDVTFRQNDLLFETFKAKVNDVENTYHYLAMNYLLVPGAATSTSGLEVKHNTDVTATFWRGEQKLFSIEKTNLANLPIQRNWRTNILGNLLAADKTFEIVVDPIFIDDHNINMGAANTSEELEALLKQDLEHIVIDLAKVEGRAAKEYTVAIGAWTEKYYFGSAKTKSITINANGNTINFVHENGDWNYIRCVNDAAKWIINDAHLTNSGKNNGPWNRHDIRFYNAVELNNVTSDKAIALLNDGELNKVEITEDGDVYALWITADGQTVDINGLDITSAGRGIAIKDQYVDTPAKVTLNVKNAKFNTQKKAAILVTSTAGADITWGEGNDIIGVYADGFNAVWVDEDMAQYAENVKVTGCNKIIEGDASFAFVHNADELKEAIASANNEAFKKIVLMDGTYTGAFDVDKKSVEMIALNKHEATIDGLVHGLNFAHITLKDLILTNNTPAASASARHNADYYCLGAYVADFLIEDCIFNVNNKDAAAGKGAINIYANRSDYELYDGFDLTIKNSVFNCNGERPIRGKTNSWIEGCTFNDQHRYAIQVQGNSGLASETVKFVNNVINNPCQTSGESFAAGVSISKSQLLEDAAFIIEGNTLTGEAPSALKFVYDNHDNVKITTCTLNGTAIVANQCVDIADDTNEVLLNYVEGVTYVGTAAGLTKALSDKAPEIALLPGITYEGTFKVNYNVTLKSADAGNKATIKGRVNIASANPIFNNIKFDRNDADSQAAFGHTVTTSWLNSHLAIIMTYGTKDNKATFDGCEFYNNNGNNKSAITNICSLEINDCLFTGTTSAIYSSARISVTNCTVDFNSTSNVFVNLDGTKGVDGYVTFTGNKAINKNVEAAIQLLTKVGYGDEKYTINIQDNEGFNRLVVNGGKMANKEFVSGSYEF